MKNLFFAFALLFLFGCAGQQVPYRTFIVDLHKGTATIKDPQNNTIGHLDITADTNGLFHLVLDNATNAMNPAVIQTSGVATADAITAAGKVAADSFAAGIKAAGKTVVP
jgi:hypothetical protein